MIMARVAIFSALVAVACIQLAYCSTKPPSSLAKSLPPGMSSPPPGDMTKPPHTDPSTRPPSVQTLPPPGGNTSPPPGGKTSSPPSGRTNPPPSGTNPPPSGKTNPPSSGGTNPPPSGRTTRPPSGRTTRPPRDRTSQMSTKVTNTDDGTLELKKEDLKRMAGAFDPEATVNFDPRRLFGRDGQISDSFKQYLGADGLKALNLAETKYRHILDLKGAFGDGRGNSEDVKAFFLLLAQSDMTNIDKLLDFPESLTAKDKIDYPLLAAMNTTVLQDKLSKAPANITDKICQDLQKKYTNGQNTKQIVKAIDCVSSLGKIGKKPDGDLAKAIADKEREKKGVSDWTAVDWTKAIDGGYISKLSLDELKLINPSKVAARLSDLKIVIKDRKKRKIITDILAQGRGRDKLKATDLSAMGDMVTAISAREFGQMNKTEMMESMSTLKNYVKTLNRAQKSQVKNQLRGSSFTKENITDAIQFMDKSIMKHIPIGEVVGALTALGAENLDKETARLVADKLRSSADYDDPSDWTNKKLKQAGGVVKGLPPKTLKEATNLNFADLLSSGDLADMKLTKDSARVAIKRVYSDSGKSKLDQSDLEKLGENIKGLGQEHVKGMDSNDLLNAMENMKETIESIAHEMDKSTKAEIIDKVKSATGGLAANAEKLASLFKDVPVAALMGENDVDFGDMTGNTPREFNCSEEQSCAFLYKKVKNAIGEPGMNNTMNYSKSTFMNLKKVMCGMPYDVLTKIPPTNELADIIEVLLDECELSKKKKDVLTSKAQYRLGVFTGVETPVSEDDVDKMYNLLPGFSVEELEALGTSMCEYIVEKMGETSTTDVSRDKLGKLTKSYSLKCMGKESGTLTEDNVDLLGKLVAGLPKDRIDDIDVESVQDVLSNMDVSALSQEKMEKLKDRLKNVMGMRSNSSDLLQTLGALVSEFSDAERLSLSEESWLSAGPQLIEAFDEQEVDLQKREMNGYSETKKDQKDRKKKRDKIMTDIKDAYINSASNTRRRKRSVSSLSCSDMQSLGSGVVSMTTNELEAMTDADFLECASFLGGTSTWSTDQIASLLTVATRSGTFRSSSAWSADNVLEAGIIVQALTSSEISALADLDLDAMSSMGQHDGWGEMQLSSGFSQWLNLNKGGDVTTVTSTELIGLGHFACGASTSHISSMSSTEYSNAATYIGELTSCTDSQFVAYADLAEKAFGTISTWDTSIVSTVGSVIGGLTATELGSLSTSQIAAITPASITQIPASVFVGFTVDQLSSFSLAQAQATTSSQQAGLSGAQLRALASAGATVDSSVSTIQASIVMMMFSPLLALLLKTV